MTSLINVSELTPEMQAYLAELDKATVKNQGPIIPELRVIASDKMADDLLKPKGHFVTISKNGEKKEFDYKGESVNVIILGINNQYTLYDKVEEKVIYQTSEFKSFDEKLVCKDTETNSNIFEGTPKEFKQFALQKFPETKANGTQGHAFKYRYVFYVLVIDDIEKKGEAGSVYRLYCSTSSMDLIREWERTLDGTPIRYVTQLTTTKVDYGTNRVYPVVFKKIAENSTEELMKYLTIKMQLDEALNGMFKEYKEDKPKELPVTTTKEIVENIPDLPIEDKPRVELPSTAGVSRQELDDIFGA